MEDKSGKKHKWYEKLDKKEHPLRRLYPVAALIYGFLEKKKKTDIFGNRRMYGVLDKNGEEGDYERLCGYKTISYILLILMCTVFLSIICIFAENNDISDEGVIKRAKTGEGSTSYDLNVYSAELDADQDITIEISEQKCAEDKLDVFFDDAVKKLKAAVIGDNPSADEITGNIYLVRSIPGTSVEVRFDDPDFTYVYSDGTVRYENIEEPVIITLTAELKYFDEIRIVSFPLRLIPRRKDALEIFIEKARDEIRKADDNTLSEEYFYLPEEINGQKVDWKVRKSNVAGIVALLGIITAFGVIPARNAEMKKLIKEREKEMMQDYPDIISKLSLLLTAGMTCRAAWEKICTDYSGHRGSSKKKDTKTGFRYAYEEMSKTLIQIKMGMSEAEAYEEFGNRCQVVAYQRLGSMLSKNLRRGSRDMTALLQTEARNALEERREKVRQRGEEVGTKLLLPMFGMFGIVIAIVIVPAIRGMGL